MLKFLLILLLFCVSIIAAAKQLPISIWPHSKCEIIVRKKTQCENRKFLSWLVRMNRKIPWAIMESHSKKDEFYCRDECLESKTCLTIQHSVLSVCLTSNSPAINNEVESTDALHLACCDKTPPEVVPEKFIPFETNNIYSHCIPSLIRNNCSHFYAWFQTNQIPFRGRDISHQSVKDLTQCFELCRTNAFCTKIFFNLENKICQMKYSQGYAPQTKKSFELATANDLAVELYCCKYENLSDLSDTTPVVTDENLPDKKPIVQCQMISTWFIVVMCTSYFILLDVYVVYIYLRIKFKESGNPSENPKKIQGKSDKERDNVHNSVDKKKKLFHFFRKRGAVSESSIGDELPKNRINKGKNLGVHLHRLFRNSTSSSGSL